MEQREHSAGDSHLRIAFWQLAVHIVTLTTRSVTFPALRFSQRWGLIARISPKAARVIGVSDAM
jgi:hypothetical protein